MLFWHQTRTQTKMEDGKSVVVKTARYDGTSQPTNGLMGAEWREYPANKYPESMASNCYGVVLRINHYLQNFNKAAFASFRYVVVL